MLEFLKGKVIEILEESFILDMGQTGFEIFTSQKTINNLLVEKDCCIYTKLNVKEDDIQLFGFSTKEERYMFGILTSVSGIGPKAALAILSSFQPGDLAMCIIREDIESLTKVKGIGKKNAGRLILELQDKMKKSKGSMQVSINDDRSIATENSEVAEAFSALIVLGYSERDVKSIISKIFKDGMSVEDIIKEALRSI